MLASNGIYELAVARATRKFLLRVALSQCQCELVLSSLPFLVPGLELDPRARAVLESGLPLVGITTFRNCHNNNNQNCHCRQSISCARRFPAGDAKDEIEVW